MNIQIYRNLIDRQINLQDLQEFARQIDIYRFTGKQIDRQIEEYIDLQELDSQIDKFTGISQIDKGTRQIARQILSWVGFIYNSQQGRQIRLGWVYI